MTMPPDSARDASAPDGVDADYFDGRHAKAHRVQVRVAGEQLVIAGDDVQRHVPLAGLQWPERTRHGARILQLPDGGALHCLDSLEWDTWSAAAAGRRDSLVVRVQQRWKWVMVSTLVLVCLIGLSYRHLLPWAARVVVAAMPETADVAIGDAALAQIDDAGVMLPTTLSTAQQEAVRAAFAQAVARLPDAPAYRLEFRKSTIGPNAFALPGGAMVLTDELYLRVDGDKAVLIGVLGHELGHLRHRDGMRMLVQAGVLGAAAGVLYGDFSSLFAQIPVLLGQASYSRDAEHQADVESVRLMRANGISPAVMASFFEKVRQPAPGDKNAKAGAMPQMPIALASHPADADRIRFFEDAARER